MYFRQLQEISDSVAEVTWDEPTVGAAIEVSTTKKVELDTKINTARARHRYLDNLAQNRDGDKMDEDETECVLCRCEFTRGYFTQWYVGVMPLVRVSFLIDSCSSGHVYCEACMKLWLAKANKTCPVCRYVILFGYLTLEQSLIYQYSVDISADTVQRFVTSTDAMKPPPKLVKSGGVAPQSTRQISYNVIGRTEFPLPSPLLTNWNQFT